MDWAHPHYLLLAPPALALLGWIEAGSTHPMGSARRRLLLGLRGLGVLLLLLALAGPASEVASSRRALGIVVDHSQSLGPEGLKQALAEAGRRSSAPGVSEVFVLRLGKICELMPNEALPDLPQALQWQAKHGSGSDYAAAMELAHAMFPPGSARELLLIGDGHDTAGGWLEMARHLVVGGTRVNAVAVAGPQRRDARVVSLRPSQNRVTQGASLKLEAEVEATAAMRAALLLYEDAVLVERRSISLAKGERLRLAWERHPSVGGVHRYRVALDDLEGDSLPDNNDAMALVEVRGRLRILMLEGEASPVSGLRDAMAAEGIDLEWRQADEVRGNAESLMGYDAVILSDLAAHRLGEALMQSLAQYVEKLGGGLLMLGGPQSFGVGGYYRTPIEEVLPVRLQSPDEEEKQSAAVALVMDRSGSMAGQKLELAKSAAMATAAVLGRQDWLGVYAFDNEAKTVVPMTRLTETAAVNGQIAALSSGGGTHLQPAFEMARTGLLRTAAKVRHMIILTDGQTTGSGYETLASQCRSDGITISTVAIGEGSHLGLLQAIASAGGGQSYTTLDAGAVTRIFTQDTLMHTGRMIREEPFSAQRVEEHPMLAGLEWERAPALLGYVRTTAKATAQVLLTTDSGEPLLAHWRHGLGRATAFTSDAKARWAGLWMTRWPQFSRFWAQVLRETARPVQGRHLDLSVQTEAGEALITVEALSDAGTRSSAQGIEAEWFHAPSDAQAALQPMQRWTLPAVGAGRYQGRVSAHQPGMHLVRVRSGAEMLTTGWVHRVDREVSLGSVDQQALQALVSASGGRLLRAEDALPPAGPRRVSMHREHWPLVLLAFLMVWLADLLVRRWEHVLSLGSALGFNPGRGRQRS